MTLTTSYFKLIHFVGAGTIVVFLSFFQVAFFTTEPNYFTSFMPFTIYLDWTVTIRFHFHNDIVIMNSITLSMEL